MGMAVLNYYQRLNLFRKSLNIKQSSVFMLRNTIAYIIKKTTTHNLSQMPIHKTKYQSISNIQGESPITHN